MIHPTPKPKFARIWLAMQDYPEMSLVIQRNILFWYLVVVDNVHISKVTS